MKAALIMGHPGHELRILKSLQRFRPRVYIITDGSGSSSSSRVQSSRALLSSFGGKESQILGKFTDRALYQLILDHDIGPLQELMAQISKDLVDGQIDWIYGDAIEGFNPTHDLCRYLINGVVIIMQKMVSYQIYNYAFTLDALPADSHPELENDAIWIHLNEVELTAKIQAALAYPEMSSEVESALLRHGKEAYKIECFQPVRNLHCLTGWTTDKPFYEIHGSNRVSSGQYREPITFEKHMKPLGESLLAFAADFDI